MSKPTLGNPQNTIEILQKYHFNFQKKFGQNFLIDTHVLEKIISAAGITKDDMVLEIGPGIGTMTQYLAEAAGKVAAVEIDKNLIPILEDTLSEYDNVMVINDDVLKVDIRGLVEKENGGRPVKVVANLPYYITTPIIMGLFEGNVPVESITVMVQKEVAQYETVKVIAEGSCRPYADRTGKQGLRSIVTGRPVLCRSVYSGKCTSELLYATTEGWFRSHSSYKTCGSSGESGQ